MVDLDKCVVIVEENATRADLYDLWLEEFDVRIALTKSEVPGAFDDAVVVTVLDETFGDGIAGDVLEWIRARDETCQVLTTAPDRSRSFPDLDVDTHLTKPVFREELRETVGRLALRANYGRVLTRYYERTLELTSVEVTDGDDGPDERRLADLDQEVADLKEAIGQIGAALDTEDVHAVFESIVGEEDLPEPDETRESKYAPNKCSGCGRKWGVGVGDDPSKGYRRLGSYVWRCVDCGKVQMQVGPGDRRLTPY